MSIETDAITEREAWEAFLENIATAARHAASHTIPRWGDESFGAVKNRVDEAFMAVGIDILDWHHPAPIRIPLTEAERDFIFDRDGRLCRWCGSTEGLQIDHIHPVRWGGTNDPANLQVLCGEHNSWKADRL